MSQEDLIPIHTMIYRTHTVWNSNNREKDVIGLAAGQPKILRYLLTHPRSFQKDISKNCDLEVASASILIDKLLKSNYIKVEKVKVDKRARWLSITPRGEDVYNRWIEYTQGLEDKMLNGLSDEDKENFRRYLDICYKNLTGHNME